MLISPRVKRSDLLDQDADERSMLSEDESPEDQQKQDESDQERKSLSYGFEYDFITPSGPPTALAKDELDQHQSYEFRLFATTTKPTSDVSTSAQTKDKDGAKSGSTGPRITLVRSPSPTSAAVTEEGRFLRPRPESHYLANPSLTRLGEYKASAITLLTLSTLSHTPWPGTSLPWRVTNLPASHLSKSLRHHQQLQPRSTTTKASSRRSKPNKKRRILLRQRLAALQPKQKKQPQPKPKPITRTPTGVIELPPEEREKRTARNREKKLKRRQRERERKAANTGDTVAAGSGDGDGGVDDDSG